MNKSTLQVIIWDSLTGETYATVVTADRLLSVTRPEELADIAHSLACGESGEEPGDWTRQSTIGFTGNGLTHQTITSHFIGNSGDVSVEIVTIIDRI